MGEGLGRDVLRNGTAQGGNVGDRLPHSLRQQLVFGPVNGLAGNKDKKP